MSVDGGNHSEDDVGVDAMAVVVGVVEAVAGEIHVFFAGGDMFPAGGDVSEGDAGTYELGQFLGVERVDFRGGVVPFWVGRHR